MPVACDKDDESRSILTVGNSITKNRVLVNLCSEEQVSNASEIISASDRKVSGGSHVQTRWQGSVRNRW